MTTVFVPLLVCAMLIILAAASYRRRGGSQRPANPRLAMTVAGVLVLLALIAYILYRHPG